MVDTCLECKAPAEWTRHTQFAGNHPYCEYHAKQQDDFGEDDSYTFWSSKKELENIIAGADQQGDDDKGYTLSTPEKHAEFVAKRNYHITNTDNPIDFPEWDNWRPNRDIS